MVGQLANVDLSIAQRVADGLGMVDPIKQLSTTVSVRTDLKPSAALSIIKKMIPGLKTKIIGCLIADGTDAAEVLALETAVNKAGAKLKIVAPKIGGAVASDGSLLEADFQLAGGSSVLFDAVYVSLSESGAKLLSTEAAAVAWVHDAFAHLKVIGANAGAQSLLTTAGVVPDTGVIPEGRSRSLLGAGSPGPDL